MKHAVVRWKENFCCITADRLAEENGLVRAYNGNELVAIYDLGTIDMIWISEEREKK